MVCSSFLRVVNRASEAGFASRFLHISQGLFFSIQLLLHALRFLLLLQLILIVLDAVVITIRLDKVNLVVELFQLALHGRNPRLLRQDPGLPLFSGPTTSVQGGRGGRFSRAVIVAG